ncbi:hypothetical protein [Gracilinema caldarium]|uniref:Uncharacterized protein n=1 Tax=Gracilinema caldarium (strain ATCC 51460 / DSM 7334 / H1) TaxID=744872 RepID=F8EZW9_GRAC1|nr:hypothetical protein [Gracilinema caldarium]AEJ18482.1 hypothetical protein Spica_0317 [Gracilinema caldarium DSM 7334]
MVQDIQNGKILFGVFLMGFVVGALVTGFILWRRTESDRQLLRERALTAYRDLDAARQAQRTAQERAGKLQEELIRIREQAEGLENRARTAAGRTESLAKQLDRAQTECNNITAGIETAEGLLTENGRLLAELGTILQQLQDSSRTGTETAGTIP